MSHVPFVHAAPLGQSAAVSQLGALWQVCAPESFGRQNRLESQSDVESHVVPTPFALFFVPGHAGVPIMSSGHALASMHLAGAGWPG
jgi:hypothetical protein